MIQNEQLQQLHKEYNELLSKTDFLTNGEAINRANHLQNTVKSLNNVPLHLAVNIMTMKGPEKHDIIGFFSNDILAVEKSAAFVGFDLTAERQVENIFIEAIIDYDSLTKEAFKQFAERFHFK